MSRKLLLVLLGTATFLTACEDKNAKVTDQTIDPNSTAMTEAPPPTVTDPYATDPMVRQDSGAMTPAPAPAPAPRPAPAYTDTGSYEPPAPAREHVGRTYVVQKGDTLSSISKRFYGTTTRWKSIWEANRRAVPDPKRMKVGTRLVIP